jgi:squalene-hopene/tetraprenyl-beta-curcumene cyclase
VIDASTRQLAADTLANARVALLAEQTPGGFWVGELSASALSTATAVFTLSLHGDPRFTPLVHGGLRWLADHQNSDGGWGDTVKSFSNLSTTCLGWAAFGIAEAKEFTTTAERAEGWIRQHAKSLDPVPLSKAVAARYGKDRTFSVPILTMLALAGRLGNDPWRVVPQLPFELAALPFSFFQVLQLPVVSYALPALIAIGQVKHAKRPTWNPLTRIARWLATGATLRKLRAIQPTTGGYLEATPLTSFVCMSLIGARRRDHEVVRHGLGFLVNSVRADGSWPIDTNLTTWVTTLAVNALLVPLSPGGEGLGVRGNGSPVSPSPLTPLPQGRGGLTDWLLRQQYRTVHPYTMAAPGGWAWTDLSGGVPDADDTPGALLALANLGDFSDSVLSAAAAGVMWLLVLQNADGGIPTFCKGWTGLPFDRSSNDLTAHAVLAWAAWRERLNVKLQQRIDAGTRRGIAYLLKTQNADGSWAPLWFGNQHADEVANLTYGTSRVLRLAGLPELPDAFREALARGANWLVSTQNADGGWGGRAGTPSTIEETALAVEGLACLDSTPALAGGVRLLASATRNGTHFPPSPIGFYFANLWYFEKLYPLVYTVAALTRIANLKS